MGKRRQRRLERQMMEATQKQMAEQQVRAGRDRKNNVKCGEQSECYDAT